ncbi:ribbon-helix-helix domain-containing protein [Haloarcula amylovorans]|uniref:hypothetical protein n=1 Tax=Haloarcula amylovorans TaxID=2562280 RepID=UPI00142F6AA7|nr:hypothetical protein [Halomicroarcula amylolytica]
MARVTLRLPDDLDKAVEEYIGYGHKSEFYREAAEEKLAREAADDTEPDEKAAENS